MLWVYLFLGLMAGVALILLCSPVVATLDTNRRECGVRWTALLRIRYPLPGGTGLARLYLAGIPLPIPRLRWKRRAKKVREGKPKPEVSRLPRIFRFLRYCAADPHLRRALVVEGGKLARGSLGSFGLSRWRAEVSFPDPALNGMLYGWLAATRWIAPTRWAGGSPLGVNFMGRNWLELEVRFYPYRMAMAGAAFLFRLPHRSIFGHWLASKTS